MTISYELSLKLKELGVEQTGGEYYWVQYPDWTFMDEECQDYIATELVHKNDIGHDRFYALDEVQCRAFTLGELVRMIPISAPIQPVIRMSERRYKASHFYENYVHEASTPEEAAGELLAETLKQKKG